LARTTSIYPFNHCSCQSKTSVFSNDSKSQGLVARAAERFRDATWADLRLALAAEDDEALAILHS
jgi:hypothetical protein